jgi:hypothetical protein
MIGVELQSIPDLSTTSPAGLKVLLKGPIVIRHSQLLLHAGNCLILGGYVAALWKEQQSALQKSKQVAMVGIDPTIRALIGTNNYRNNTNTTTTEEDDEAHEASGDVLPSHPPLQQQQQQQQSPPPVPPLQHQRQLQHDFPHDTNTTNENDIPRSLTQQQSTNLSITRSAWSSNHTPLLPPPPQQQTHPAPSRQYSQPGPRMPLQIGHQQTHDEITSTTTTRTTTTTTTPITTTKTTAKVINPYVTSSSSLSSSTATSASRSNPYLPKKTTTTLLSSHSHQNPGTAGGLTTAGQSTSIAHGNTTSTSITPPTSSITTTSSTSTKMNNIDIVDARNPSQPNSTTINNNNNNTIVTSTKLSSTNIQRMDLPNLCTLLSTLVQNREMYDSYYRQGIMFRVPLIKAAIGQVNFNVVKNKDYRRRKSQDQQQHQHHHNNSNAKYEYFIALIFGDVDQNNNNNDNDINNNHNHHNHDTTVQVAGRIHPFLIDAQFDVSATDLRAMTRTDREQSQLVTNVGGAKVHEQYFGPCRWTARLNLSTAELFDERRREMLASKSILDLLTDLQCPILLLQDPEPI